jgi:hypothetical protein
MYPHKGSPSSAFLVSDSRRPVNRNLIEMFYKESLEIIKDKETPQILTNLLPMAKKGL